MAAYVYKGEDNYRSDPFELRPSEPGPSELKALELKP